MNGKRPKTSPTCFSCRHFFVTWDAEQPRACKAYGFKTRAVPSLVVKRTTGEECLMHEPKAQPSGKRMR